MGFAGNLRTLALPEVLQTLNRIRATGVLRLASADGGRDVVFNDGELVGIAFRRGEERQALLRRLILDGRLDATTVAQVSSLGRESQVVQRLVEDGVVDEAAVREAVSRQVEDELTCLFTWDYADFVFHDAGPEAPEITESVERAKATGVTFNLNSLLMESARRQDEWERLRAAIPDPGLVLGPREGQESALTEAGKAYPGSAVVPLIDAVRSVDDIVHDSVATRLDVYAVLAPLLDRGAVVTLTRDDIIYHGDYLLSQTDLLRAASLFRRALAVRPADQETAGKLADCLARLGDAPEAAACHAQLALGSLGQNDPSGAVQHARRAAQLAPQDPSVRQTLVRCLLAQDPKRNLGEAVDQLNQMVDIFLGLDRLEDARGTCLKVLELDRQNEPARRQLARIFSAAAQEEQSEDVVVCVQCGEVNHREASSCTKCAALLQLQCLSCQRAVAVSDRLCIFCGANPHQGDSGVRRVAGSPTTSRIINKGRPPGPAIDITSGIDELVQAAQAREEAQDWDGALAAWREVAKVQVDNADLLTHIRDLEKLVHDRFVEARIEEGHQMRRVRRYWAAIKAYKTALRTMASDDPRAQRLTEILANTERVGQRIALVYCAAIILIGVFAWMVTKPFLVERGLRGEIAELSERFAGQAAAPAGAVLEPLLAEVQALAQRIEELGSAPRWSRVRGDFAQLKGDADVAWLRAGQAELAQIDNAIKDGFLDKAQAGMAAFQVRYPDQAANLKARHEHLAAEKSRREALKRRIDDAPALLKQAQAIEAAGRLSEALSAFQTLAESPNTDIATAAKARVHGLAPRAEAANRTVESAFIEAQGLMQSDLVRAQATLAAVVADAGPWGHGERLANAQSRIAAALTAAQRAAAALGPQATADELDAFLRQHGGSPEAPAIRNRREAIERGRQAREAGIERFRQLIADQQWEQAYEAGRELVRGYGTLVGDLRLPLLIDTPDPGASVKVDGKPAGQTPCVVYYAPGAKGEVSVESAGWQRVSHRLEELSASWRWRPAPERAQVWRAELGKGVGALAALATGDIAVSGSDGLAVVSMRGQVRWRVALTGDDLGGGTRQRHLDAPTLLPDGRLALGLIGKDGVLLDGRGGAARITTAAEVRGRPLSYLNEVMGATQRIAFAAEAIYSGEPGALLSRVPIPAAAISGPVSVARDIDRLLVIADVRGRLTAIDETSKAGKAVWEQDLQAADVGQLIPISETDIVCLLDGSRLACWSLGATGATLRWTHQLESPAVGEPVMANGVIHLASGASVARIAIDGTVMPALALPAVASGPPHALGDRVVAGTTDGQLLVFRGGDLLWRTPTASPATAVLVTRDAIVAGSASGAVTAYAP